MTQSIPPHLTSASEFFLDFLLYTWYSYPWVNLYLPKSGSQSAALSFFVALVSASQRLEDLRIAKKTLNREQFWNNF